MELKRVVMVTKQKWLNIKMCEYVRFHVDSGNGTVYRVGLNMF